MFILFVLLLTISVAGCSSSDKDVQHEKKLAVTIEPYRFVAEAVAGDEWKVMCVVPKGGSPETFDLSPKQIMELSACSIYFMVGGIGFENTWKDKIADVCPLLSMVDTSVGIEKVCDDPHLWTSPDNMRVIARNICNALSDADSVNREKYATRLHDVEEMILHTDSLIRERLKGCDNKSFLIFHPSLTYFSKLYGLNQIVLEEHGKEPSASHVKHVVDEARRDGVRQVLVQAEFDKKHAETIALELDAELVTVNPLSFDWQSEMLHIADCLKNDE